MNFEKLQKEQIEFEKNLQLNEKEKELTRLKAQLDVAIRKYEALQKSVDFVHNMDISNVKNYKITPKEKTNTAEGCPVIMWSDSHIFEQVRPEEVNDLNEYNFDIAKKRIKNFLHGVCSWIESYRSRMSVKEAVLFLGGDNMTGHIHEDQMENNYGTPIEETIELYKLLKTGIDYIQESMKFKTLTVVCNVGNHSRYTQKTRMQNLVQHSYEWLVYNLLQDNYSDQKNIKFVVADGYHAFVNIYGKECRFHHGDAFRYNGGVGGFTIPVNRKISEWNKGRRADYDFFGHMHTYLDNGKWISNGTTMGYSPLAVRWGYAYEPPTQTIVLIDKKRGITSTNRVYCE